LIGFEGGHDFGHEIVIDLFHFLSSRSIRECCDASFTSAAATASLSSIAATAAALTAATLAALARLPALRSDAFVDIPDLLEGTLDNRPERLLLITAQRDIGFALQKGFDLFHRIDGIHACKHLTAATAAAKRRTTATAAGIILRERGSRDEEGGKNPE
jgi:hypothetical protein